MQNKSMDIQAVFMELEKDRRLGLLKDKILQGADFWYESSEEFPGYIIKVSIDGNRQIGHMVEGIFQAVSQD